MRGSVRKPRTDGGAWSYRIDSGLDDRGRRRQREVGGFRTKKDAQTALNEALADTQRGTYSPPSRTTVREFLDEWHEGARTELALTAWTNYGQIIRRNINPYLGNKRLTDLSPLDVKRWHGKLLENGRRDGSGLSVASVKLAHRILRRALADAVRWNLIMRSSGRWMRSPTSCGDVASGGASATSSFATMTISPRSSHSSGSRALSDPLRRRVVEVGDAMGSYDLVLGERPSGHDMKDLVRGSAGRPGEHRRPRLVNSRQVPTR